MSLKKCLRGFESRNCKQTKRLTADWNVLHLKVQVALIVMFNYLQEVDEAGRSQDL